MIRECQWKAQLRQIQTVDTTIGHILKHDTEKTLLKGISDDKVFGFAVCDVTTPPEILTEISGDGFLFPPLIQRMEIDESTMSDFMKKRFIEEGLAMKRTTVVQTFNCKQQLLMTPLLKFYMKLGLKISNVTKFIQYVPGAALEPFANKVYRMRCEATKEGGNSREVVGSIEQYNTVLKGTVSF